jgi:hypothetical protein
MNIAWTFVVASLVCWAVFVVLFVGACAPARSAADIETCLAKVQIEMLAKVRGACPPGPFVECPDHDDIMSEWDARAEACK